MNLHKTCSCGRVQTTKNAEKIGRDDIALYFNCVCNSTFMIRAKNWKQTVIESMKKAA